MSGTELEGAVRQFFDPSIPYGRKRDIEASLTQFRAQPDSWRQCESLLVASTAAQASDSRANIQWFCLSVLEEAVVRHWLKLAPGDREHIKQFVVGFLGAHHASLPAYVLNKLVKLVSELGRRTWPDNFPELLPTIQTFLFDRTARNAGLCLLKTVCEDFSGGGAGPAASAPRIYLPAARCQELRMRFMQHVPGILVLMKQILDDAYVRPNSGSHQRSVSATVTPITPLSASVYAFASPQLAGNALYSPPPRGEIDAETQLTCLAAMEVLMQLFTWIPLSEHVGMPLLDTLLKFLQLNDSANAVLGVHGMACVEELVSRKWAPDRAADCLMLIFQYVMEILKFLTTNSSGGDDNKMDDLDEDYRAKFTSFLCALVRNHLHRLVENRDFPFSTFMELVYNYTFQQPNVHSMRECLALWEFFVDFVVTQYQAGSSSYADRFKGGLLNFMNELVRKMQYLQNTSELSDLEDSEENENGLTDYDQFLDELLEIIAQMAHLYPTEVVPLLYSQLESLEDSFTAICVATRDDNRPMAETARIHYVFKDMRTLLRVFGRLSEAFSDNFSGYFQSTLSMLQRYVEVLRVALQAFPNYNDFGDFPKLCAELYSVFQAYVHWLSILSREAKSETSLLAPLDSLVSTILEACIAVLQSNVPARIAIAASSLFQSICITVKPANLFSYTAVAEFISNIHQVALPLPKQAKSNLYCASANACLNLLPGSEQEVAAQFNSFVAGLTGPFIELSTDSTFFSGRRFETSEVQEKVVHVIIALTSLIDSVQGEKSSIKLVLYSTVKDALPFSLALFRSYLNDRTLTEVMMEMFVALFRSLRKQMGAQTASNVLSEFISILSTEQIRCFLAEDSSAGAELIEKFIELLKLLVEDNSRAFDSLTPSVVSFCIDSCGLVLKESDTAARDHVASSYFPLVHSLLVHNWKYFFPATTIHSSGDATTAPTAQNRAFSALLEMFIVFFKEPSPELYRNNLSILTDINAKCRLYANPFFKHSMLQVFVNVLLADLLARSHETAQEETVLTIFSLATSDFNSFRETCLPQFFGTQPIPAECRDLLCKEFTGEQDLASFRDSIDKCIGDLRFYLDANSFQI